MRVVPGSTKMFGSDGQALQPKFMAFDRRLLETLSACASLLIWMYERSRAVHPQQTLPDLGQRTLLFLAQVRHGREMRRLHGVVSPLHRSLAWRPSLVSVVRRPYVTSGWGPSRRLAAIEQHYRLLAERGRALQLAPAADLELASVTAREKRIKVVLDSPAWFIHEGELCLSLFHNDHRIYTLAFSLGFDAGVPVAYVGALQGLRSDHALALYRTLTTAFHGLRPRDLLIAVFRMVCRELGLGHWLAVSDRYRVSCSDYFRATAAVHTSYDAVWSTHHGWVRPDGFYRMPVSVARRSIEAMPTRKRSSYRKRYELLDSLDAELTLTIERRSRTRAPENR